MSDRGRPKVNPPLKCSFDQVYELLLLQPEKKVTGLFTSDNSEFEAIGKSSDKVGKFIALPYDNRIYPGDWGFQVNRYKSGGQRIGQYSKSLDEWCLALNSKPIDNNEISLPFKPRARLIPELGEQLIKNESIAFLELVKNSYDACAKKCDVYLTNIENKDESCIIVEDNGFGMDYEIIKNVWMEPGTSNKSRYFSDDPEEKLVLPCNRLPLGEKGIGRFAAHKIGNEITLISRMEGKKEIFLTIDWTNFFVAKYLDEVPIKIIERKPEYFTDEKTGTKIIIKKIKKSWERGLVREIYRSIISMTSPFDTSEKFLIPFHIDKKDLIKGILTWDEIKKYALFKVRCKIEPIEKIVEEGTKKKFNEITEFSYELCPWDTMQKIENPTSIYYSKIEFNKDNCTDEQKRLEKSKNIFRIVKKDEKNVIEFIENLNVGPIIFEALIFDLDANLLRLGLQTGRRDLKDYLKANGGVRVYRDNVRVYDYGEPGNDWLDLGPRRVNVPGKRISNNLIIGAVHIERSKSNGLKEKTNREGFIDNQDFYNFRDSILYLFNLIEIFRKPDKELIRSLYGPSNKSEPVIDSINKLRDTIQKKISDDELKNELNEQITKIQEDYEYINKILLKSAGAGLSLSVVIHEIEKIIKELDKALQKNDPLDNARRLVDHLTKLVAGYTETIANYGKRNEDLRKIVDRALFNNTYRFEAHKIQIEKDYSKYSGFKVDCSRDLIITSVSNIFDNSIFWLEHSGKTDKKIFISISSEKPDYESIVVADTGSGFGLPPEQMVKPFVSLKPGGGMGLGLHIANEVMIAHGGELIFPEWGDYEIPDEYKDGAVVVIAFRKKGMNK